MSGLKEQYIAAGAQLIAEKNDIDKVVSGLKATMTRRGHTRLLRGVLSGLMSKVSRESQTSAPRLTLSDEADKKQYASLAKGANIKIDPSIIGGYVFKEGYTRTDGSYKTKLLNWYRSATR